MNHKQLSDADTSPFCKLLNRLASPLEGLANLTFLALEHADHPEKVRFYMLMAEEHMHVVRQIVLETYNTAQAKTSTSIQL